MNRPLLEVADIVRAHGEAYLRRHVVSSAELRVLRDIASCRTAALGGHVDVCDGCGHREISYNSCRNRHCAKCQSLSQAKWIEARMARVLPTPHFHVVFTLPAELRPLAIANRERVFDLLFASAAQSLLGKGLAPSSPLACGHRICSPDLFTRSRRQIPRIFATANNRRTPSA